jgi:hypothetical protein
MPAKVNTVSGPGAQAERWGGRECLALDSSYDLTLTDHRVRARLVLVCSNQCPV